MPRIPIYKEANQLAEQYKQRGIKYVYNQRNKYVYLSLLHAPLFAEGETDCHMTGYLIIYGGVAKTRDIESCVDDVKRNYKKCWQNNPLMIKYLDTVQ